ncbi:hypothetical protein M0R45_025658 [Rubus argutus]|uniref:Uncharacterized protein n=1 Tax=Rubus argutus TaxID=59490 RepID=A0AAW1WXP5_RUBAR
MAALPCAAANENALNHSNIIYTIPFKHFKSYTIPFSKEDLCKDENLSEVWKTDVEDVFASHGLSCTLKWNEGAMTMAETENTCYGQVVDNCFHALLTITCGLRAEWVEPIVSGTVAANAFRLWAPVGMKFSRKYDEFIHKFEDEFVLATELFCQVLYKEKTVFVLADTWEATNVVGRLLDECLMRNEPFDDAHVRLLLDDFRRLAKQAHDNEG